MSKVRWVPEAAVRAMHSELIAEHGGRAGIRDDGLLSSALARPRNKRVYGGPSSVFGLAAAYGYATVRNHPFVDGNKRVAFSVMYVFLEMNGYLLEAPEVEVVDVMLRLAAGEMEEKDLSAWLRRNSVAGMPIDRRATRPNADREFMHIRHGLEGTGGRTKLRRRAWRRIASKLRQDSSCGSN